MRLKTIYGLLKRFIFILFFLESLSSISENLNGAKQNTQVKNDIKTLLIQANKLQRKDPEEALKKTNQALHLINQKHSNTLLAEANFQKAYAFFMLGKIDSSLVLLKGVLSMHEIKSSMKAKTLNLLCIDYRKSGEHEKAIDAAQQAQKLFLVDGDSSGMTEALINEGKVYHHQGNNKKAMLLFLDALQFMEKTGNTIETGTLHCLIGNVYMDLGQITKGKEYYRRAVAILHNYQNTTIVADMFNNFGITFYDEGVYDSALYYYNKALTVYQNVGQTDAVAACLQNIGITYIFLNEKDKGLYDLHRSYQIFKKRDLPSDQASVLIDLGTAFTEINEIDSATLYLQKAYNIALSVQNSFYVKSSLFRLYKLFEKDGKYKKALSYYHRYTIFKDSMENQAMKENLQELEIKYKTARRENEIIQLKDRELLNKAQKSLLIVGILGVAAAFILTVIILIIRRRKDSIIHQQKLLVHEKEKKLAITELEKRKAHEKQLENELEFKTKQLATHALNMMQKNKLLQSISADIEVKMNAPDCADKTSMKQILHTLKQGLNTERDWELFKVYFEQINESFFDKLKKINPNLTGNDYRLCALTKLNLNIKEMASVLNISPESLKNGRYRLKKKLNLTVRHNLNIFLSNL